MKRIRISSSIANFRDNLRRRYWDYGDFKWLSTDPTLFFGCYHWLDYLRIILHRGPRVVFWCGSDLLAVSPFKARLLRRFKILHYVENDIEWFLLHQFDIKALVQPMFFGNAKDYPVSYTQSDYPQVFISAHRGRAGEYGVTRLLRVAKRVPGVMFHIYGVEGVSANNVVFHGRVPNKTFDEEIRRYQAGLRLNRFDGFGEVLAKSVLLGQYPISTIPYYGIDTALGDDELVRKLKELRTKREPNPFRKHWFELLSKRVEI